MEYFQKRMEYFQKRMEYSAECQPAITKALPLQISKREFYEKSFYCRRGIKQKAAHLGGTLLLSLVVSGLYLDLHLNTTGEFELHQSINSLSCRAVDVNQTLEV